METIIGKSLRGERVALDNRSFVSCTFSDCVLEYRGDPVSFQQTRLSHCKYVFEGPAKRTVLFLQETGLMPFDPAEWGEFEDGVFDTGSSQDGEHRDGVSKESPVKPGELKDGKA